MAYIHLWSFNWNNLMKGSTGRIVDTNLMTQFFFHITNQNAKHSLALICGIEFSSFNSIERPNDCDPRATVKFLKLAHVWIFIELIHKHLVILIEIYIFASDNVKIYIDTNETAMMTLDTRAEPLDFFSLFNFSNVIYIVANSLIYADEFHSAFMVQWTQFMN